VILAIFSFVLIFVFVELLDQYKTLQEEQASIKNELLYWENVLAAVPNSPDVYFQAGVVAFQLGDKKLASQYITEALALDPTFEAAIQLQEKISNE
jgi:tetratricopeptide (TPR) repeat protein